jgi:hypothetical protein
MQAIDGEFAGTIPNLMMLPPGAGQRSYAISIKRKQSAVNCLSTISQGDLI